MERPERLKERTLRTHIIIFADALEESKVHHKIGEFIPDLQEQMLRMANEIGLLKNENRELQKRVVIEEDAARKEEIEEKGREYDKLDVQIQCQMLATTVATLANLMDKDTDYAEFVEYVTLNTMNGADRAKKLE